jgi:hypothetical protein
LTIKRRRIPLSSFYKIQKKQKRRRIVIDNNPPFPSLHLDFDEQTPSLLGTIIIKSQIFGTYSKHPKWVFNIKFNTHERNIAIG